MKDLLVTFEYCRYRFTARITSGWFYIDTVCVWWIEGIADCSFSLLNCLLTLIFLDLFTPETEVHLRGKRSFTKYLGTVPVFNHYWIEAIRHQPVLLLRQVKLIWKNINQVCVGYPQICHRKQVDRDRTGFAAFSLAGIIKFPDFSKACRKLSAEFICCKEGRLCSTICFLRIKWCICKGSLAISKSLLFPVLIVRIDLCQDRDRINHGLEVAFQLPTVVGCKLWNIIINALRDAVLLFSGRQLFELLR